MYRTDSKRLNNFIAQMETIAVKAAWLQLQTVEDPAFSPTAAANTRKTDARLQILVLLERGLIIRM